MGKERGYSFHRGVHEKILSVSREVEAGHKNITSGEKALINDVDLTINSSPFPLGGLIVREIGMDHCRKLE